MGYIKSLYVCGNSFSATTPGTAYQMWPGMLSQKLGFAFVQLNNKAQPGAGLFNGINPPRPGLLKQIRSFPTASKTTALLVPWIFPAQFKPAEYVPAYTTAMDVAIRQQGFRMIMMPNYPDATRTAYAKSRYTAAELATIRASYVRFNAGYNTMIASWRSRYQAQRARFIVIDMFTLWDGKGTVPDGLHPNFSSHKLFANWFWAAAQRLLPQ